MSKVFGFSGGDNFCRGGSILSNLKESNLFVSLGHHADVYFPPCKRPRISAPFIFNGEKVGKKNQVSIETLPDECLFEIFRRLPGGQERMACASVSKQWLMLLSSICGNEIYSNKPLNKEKSCDDKEADDQEIESDGYLSRSLEGKKATDVRLAAIAVGTASRGGLGKLSIRGNDHGCGVTNLGLRAIARGCPSLKAFSLWNVSTLDDEGINEIANGCHMLQKLDLCKCPSISDKSLLAIAKNCPNLTELAIESCSNIGNDGLQALGEGCPNLRSLTIKDCPRIADQGIASLLSSTSFVLTKVKLQGLSITDFSLAIIGHYGKAVTDLALTGIPNISERGFWAMGNGHGLQKLKSLTISSCRGVTDIGLEAVGKGCPNLKYFCLRKCAFLSDNGLVSFAKSAVSIESIHLEECHRITQIGLFGVILNCGAKLKAFTLVSCIGIKDIHLGLPLISQHVSLRSLSVRNCPGFGDSSLSLLAKLCPQLQHVELSGLERVTDAGFLPLVESCDTGLVKVNLSGCNNLTDKVVLSITKQHGWTLETLNLDGCQKISDASLVAIARDCLLLSDLDVSKCGITDAGIAGLACAIHLNLQVLSLSGCSKISNKSLPALKKLGQTLLGLNIQHCNAITSRTVDLLINQLWRCDILS